MTAKELSEVARTFYMGGSCDIGECDIDIHSIPESRYIFRTEDSFMEFCKQLCEEQWESCVREYAMLFAIQPMRKLHVDLINRIKNAQMPEL